MLLHCSVGAMLCVFSTAHPGSCRDALTIGKSLKAHMYAYMYFISFYRHVTATRWPTTVRHTGMAAWL